jgi:hypothetical protein
VLPVIRLLSFSGPEGPPDADSVLRTEGVARQTHNAKIAFFRENAVSLNFDKNSHGAQVNAFVVMMAMMGFYAQVRINVHLNSYRCRGPNFHKYHLFFGKRIRNDTGTGGSF